MVHFDGRRSRSEETNVDYGVRSPGFELRSGDRDTVTACRSACRSFRFCVERPVERPSSGRPPGFTPLGGTATIAGLRCSKAVVAGPRRLQVWFCEDLDVDDPTGASAFSSRACPA